MHCLLGKEGRPARKAGLLHAGFEVSGRKLLAAVAGRTFSGSARRRTEQHGGAQWKPSFATPASGACGSGTARHTAAPEAQLGVHSEAAAGRQHQDAGRLVRVLRREDNLACKQEGQSTTIQRAVSMPEGAGAGKAQRRSWDRHGSAANPVQPDN